MSFLRTLQTSARARYAVYAVAGAGTYYGVHKYHQSRKPIVPHASKVESHASKGPTLKESESIITKKVKEAEETKSASTTPSLTEEVEAALGDHNPEEEEKNTGAFDPVTGEINWDCPCLGGMAHGPCGPQFREAFSCFVYSEGEPKGIDCVEKFRDMQECFRAHPEIYAEELRDDDEGPDLESPSSSNDSTDGVPPSTGGEGLPKPSPSHPPTHGEDISIPAGDVLPTPEGGIVNPLPDPTPQPPPLPESDKPTGPPPTPASGDPRTPPPGRPRGEPRKQPTGVPPPRPRPKPSTTGIVDPTPRPVGTGIGGTEVASVEIEKA